MWGLCQKFTVEWHTMPNLNKNRIAQCSTTGIWQQAGSPHKRGKPIFVIDGIQTKSGDCRGTAAGMYSFLLKHHWEGNSTSTEIVPKELQWQNGAQHCRTCSKLKSRVFACLKFALPVSLQYKLYRIDTYMPMINKLLTSMHTKRILAYVVCCLVLFTDHGYAPSAHWEDQADNTC